MGGGGGGRGGYGGGGGCCGIDARDAKWEIKRLKRKADRYTQACLHTDAIEITQ